MKLSRDEVKQINENYKLVDFEGYIQAINKTIGEDFSQYSVPYEEFKETMLKAIDDYCKQYAENGFSIDIKVTPFNTESDEEVIEEQINNDFSDINSFSKPKSNILGNIQFWEPKDVKPLPNTKFEFNVNNNPNQIDMNAYGSSDDDF